MPAYFKSNGATGQAPTTVFFGTVPDRLTMGLPYHPFFHLGTIDVVLPAAQVAADYINKWSILNTIYLTPGTVNADTVSLGGFITAPDGTANTMQKVVETTTTSLHGMTSGWYSDTASGLYKVRLAVFAKAAERTRIALEFNTNLFAGDAVGTGVRTVFDLAGGQIGVATHSFGVASGDPNVLAQMRTWDTAAANAVAAIIPFGNGVYICQMDVPMGLQLGGIPSVMYANFWLDSGSGTNAESIVYAGDGVSGVYAWKSCCLPPDAWRLGNEVFRDDFDDPTMSNIDLTDSRAPGFDWYIHNSWPNFGAQPLNTPSNPAWFSQSGSVLSITGLDRDTNTMLTAGSLGPGAVGNIGGVVYQRPLPGPNAANAYVGKGFTPPMLAASRHAFGINFGNGHSSWWTTSLERLYNISPNTSTVILPTDQLIAVENDWEENGVQGGAPAHACFGGDRELTRMQVLGDYVTWYPTVTYQGNSIVGYLGQTYQAQQISLNQIPASNPAYWLPFTPGLPSGPGTTDCDPSQMNTYEVMWFPVSPTGDLGQMVQFFNGVFVRPLNAFTPFEGHFAWGQRAKDQDHVVPAQSGYDGITAFWEGDSQTMPIIYLGNAGAASDMFIDWVSIINE